MDLERGWRRTGAWHRSSSCGWEMFSKQSMLNTSVAATDSALAFAASKRPPTMETDLIGCPADAVELVGKRHSLGSSSAASTRAPSSSKASPIPSPAFSERRDKELHDILEDFEEEGPTSPQNISIAQAASAALQRRAQESSSQTSPSKPFRRSSRPTMQGKLAAARSGWQ